MIRLCTFSLYLLLCLFQTSLGICSNNENDLTRINNNNFSDDEDLTPSHRRQPHIEITENAEIESSINNRYQPYSLPGTYRMDINSFLRDLFPENYQTENVFRFAFPTSPEDKLNLRITDFLQSLSSVDDIIRIIRELSPQISDPDINAFIEILTEKKERKGSSSNRKQEARESDDDDYTYTVTSSVDLHMKCNALIE